MRRAAKMEQAVDEIIACHREQDAHKGSEAQDSKKHKVQLEKLQREAKQIRAWLEANPEDRKGSKGALRLSDRTDPESAKMATGKGVIQGYTGVAAVDEKLQVIVAAQAHGTGSEQELLVPVVEALQPLCAEHSVIAADSGYHSKANLEKLEADQIEAFIPDNGYRKRDTPIKPTTKTSPTRCGTSVPPQTNRNCSGRRTSNRRTTSPTVSAQPASSSIEMEPTAMSADTRQSSSPAPSAIANTVRYVVSACAIPTRPRCTKSLSS